MEFLLKKHYFSFDKNKSTKIKFTFKNDNSGH